MWLARRGGGGAPVLRILRKKGSSFKTSECPRFCKRRVLLCTQVQSTIHEIYAALTPSDSRSDWVTGLPSFLPPLAAAKHAEDYKM